MGEHPLTTKRCPACGENKPTSEYYDRGGSRKGQLSSECKACWGVRTKKAWLTRVADVNKANYSRYLNAKRRARKKNIPFTLTFDQIVWPSHCPVLGVELDYTLGTKGSGVCKNSPSLDRIIPSLGYVPGNVVVVCSFVNTVKNCATVDQLKKVAAFYEQLIPHVGGSNVPEDHRLAEASVA